jgi:threonine/homoserine/homoserine lactone efflux protein
MPDLLIPFLIFGLSMSFTPGPNVIMIAASGVNFGWRRSIPLYFGVVLGFMSLLLAVGFGLGAVFDRYPAIHNLLRYAGAAYLIWLGIRIATSGRKKSAAEPNQNNEAGRRPFSFLQGAALQWVNPKGWIMAVGAMSIFTLPDRAIAPQVLLIVAILGAMGFASMALWLGSSVLIARYLTTEQALRRFNIALGISCILSVVLIFV